MKQGEKVLILENAVGYGIYSEEFHWHGEKIQSLYFTAKTKAECEEWIDKHPSYYTA